MTNSTGWNGSPQYLSPGAAPLNMPQTTNGAMVLAALNVDKMNNDGTLQYQSGGAQPQTVDLPALKQQPTLVINNWQGQNLKVANQSVTSTTRIYVSACGPGIPGVVPTKLVPSKPVAIGVFQSLQGTTNPNWMTLKLTSSDSTDAVATIIGGPNNSASLNAYTIELNALTTSGVPSGQSGQPPLAGYYATTSQGTYSFPFNWQSTWQIFVANQSSSGVSITVTLLNY